MVLACAHLSPEGKGRGFGGVGGFGSGDRPVPDPPPAPGNPTDGDGRVHRGLPFPPPPPPTRPGSEWAARNAGEWGRGEEMVGYSEPFCEAPPRPREGVVGGGGRLEDSLTAIYLRRSTKAPGWGGVGGRGQPAPPVHPAAFFSARSSRKSSVLLPHRQESPPPHLRRPPSHSVDESPSVPSGADHRTSRSLSIFLADLPPPPLGPRGRRTDNDPQPLRSPSSARSLCPGPSRDRRASASSDFSSGSIRASF